MSTLRMIGVSLVSALAVALLAIAWALFHGYFDRGRFEVKETSWSSSGRVAVVAERSDREALSSYVYFVLVGDHVFSPSELRAAYYRHRVVFAAASDCVSVRWSDTHNLTVMCGNGAIDAEHIELQQRKTEDVAITYINIPDRSFREK